MAFLVDIVSEESFYENLTLGITKILATTTYVQDVELEKRLPCERLPLASWEQRHCCTLPEDLRQFYLSSDGFRLRWNYQYGGVGFLGEYGHFVPVHLMEIIKHNGRRDEVLPVGDMKINTISELRRLAGVKNVGDPDCPTLLDIEVCSQLPEGADTTRPRPNFGVKCKIFELDSCQGNGKVCLVYSDRSVSEQDLKREDPKVWLLDRCFDWHFLADTFTQYFRMMLAHLGLPQWQFRFTSMGPTPWAENIIMMVAPHLLQTEPSKVTIPIDWSEVPNNHIDPSIFKIRTKSSKKKVANPKGRH